MYVKEIIESSYPDIPKGANLYILGAWMSKWQISFNMIKYKVMHIDTKNSNYKAMDSVATDEERNLGVIVNGSMMVLR